MLIVSVQRATALNFMQNLVAFEYIIQRKTNEKAPWLDGWTVHNTQEKVIQKRGILVSSI
jgi:hypothetical protein